MCAYELRNLVNLQEIELRASPELLTFLAYPSDNNHRMNHRSLSDADNNTLFDYISHYNCAAPAINRDRALTHS